MLTSRYLRGLIVIATVLFLTMPLPAGTTGKVAGTVKDASSGEGLPGANVVLEGTTLGAATDFDGNYVILNVPPGTYSVVATMIGYQSVKNTNVRVSIDLTSTVSFTLSEETLELGEEVVVVAERELIRKDMTGSLAAVGADEISTIPVQEISDVLELQAGVVSDNFGNIHVRGGRSSEVAFWIDGISATDAYNGTRGIAVENSSVQELQVISGTFNAEYGQAMSGIINVVTKDGGATYHGEISAYTGDYLISNQDQYQLMEAYRFDGSPAELYDIRGTNTALDSVRGLDTFNSLKDYEGIANVEGSLSGPVPLTNSKVTFFTNLRYFDNPGWQRGLRWFTPQGTSGDRATVAMNPFQKLSFQGKVAWSIRPTLKLRYNLLLSDVDFRDYNHFYRYNPDGALKSFDNSLTHILSATHTINSRTFYELRVTAFNRDFKRYTFEDPTNGIDYVREIPGDTTSKWIADPNGDREGYVHPDSLIAPDFSFSRAGTDAFHQTRTTKFNIAKFDLSSQINNQHLLKAGAELRAHELHNRQFSVVPATEGGEEITPFQPAVPPASSPEFFEYNVKPMEISAYVQDKMEFQSIIINLGLRYDLFDPDGQVLVDSSDLEAGSVAAKTLSQFSPRLGIAYPITDRGVIHFSYGHFFQIPAFEYLYDYPVFKVTRASDPTRVLANAGLEPQRTVMYELGLQQQLAVDFAFDVTLFYRDIRDWVGTGNPITFAPGRSYVQYENKDYSNVRGITLALDKRYSRYWSLGIDYTFQVAEGTNSNPGDAYEDLQNDREPRISLVPLNWDQRHTINGSISVGPSDWRASLIGRYWSGLPYTPTISQGTVFGAGSFKGLPANSDRRPDQFSFDLRLYKNFRLGPGNLSLFASVYNLFDQRNEPGVYDDTGRAGTTLNLRNASSDPNRITTAPFNAIRPDYYNEPRQVQLGMSLGF